MDISSFPNAAAADRQGNHTHQKQKRTEHLTRNGGPYYYNKLNSSTLHLPVGSDVKLGNSNDDKINNIAKKEAFQKAWDEAHEMFREKMKKKEKQAI